MHTKIKAFCTFKIKVIKIFFTFFILISVCQKFNVQIFKRTHSDILHSLSDEKKINYHNCIQEMKKKGWIELPYIITRYSRGKSFKEASAVRRWKDNCVPQPSNRIGARVKKYKVLINRCPPPPPSISFYVSRNPRNLLINTWAASAKKK